MPTTKRTTGPPRKWRAWKDLRERWAAAATEALRRKYPEDHPGDPGDPVPQPGPEKGQP